MILRSPAGTGQARDARAIVCHACLAVTAMLAATSAPARADVFEIGDGGTLRVRNAAAAVQWVEPDTVSADGEDAPGVPDEAVTRLAAAPVPDAWRATVDKVAADSRISPALIAAMIGRESAWRPTAVSAKGAIGLAQLMPATARALAVDPRDPAASLAGGARYLRLMLDRFDGNVERALAAYNAGPGRVLRAGGIPAIAETRTYVSTIIDRLAGPAVRSASSLVTQGSIR